MVEVQTALNVVADVEDNAVLAAAVDGRVDYLVTGDPHLLAHGQYEQCRIVTPDQFLEYLKAQEQQ
jgi:predicted nucleic acid-binding protein